MKLFLPLALLVLAGQAVIGAQEDSATVVLVCAGTDSLVQPAIDYDLGLSTGDGPRIRIHPGEFSVFKLPPGEHEITLFYAGNAITGAYDREKTVQSWKGTLLQGETKVISLEAQYPFSGPNVFTLAEVPQEQHRKLISLRPTKTSIIRENPFVLRTPRTDRFYARVLGLYPLSAGFLESSAALGWYGTTGTSGFLTGFGVEARGYYPLGIPWTSGNLMVYGEFFKILRFGVGALFAPGSDSLALGELTNNKGVLPSLYSEWLLPPEKDSGGWNLVMGLELSGQYSRSIQGGMATLIEVAILKPIWPVIRPYMGIQYTF